MKKKRVLLLTTLITVLLSLVCSLLLINTNNINPVKSNSLVGTYTFTLNNSNFGFLPTTAGNGQSTNSNSPKTSNNTPIIFSYNSTFRDSARIRMNKNTGAYIANVTPFSGLRYLSITIASGQATLSLGNSYSNYGSPITVSKGTTNFDIDSTPYFKIAVGSSSLYLDSITAEYICDGSASLKPIMDHTHHGYHYAANEATTEKAGNYEFYACKECEYVSLDKEDNGEYIDTILTYELPSNHIAYIAPLYKERNDLLKTPAQYPYPIAVNAIIPSTSYPADNTGKSDASGLIQLALNNVSNMGGGTVYISAGKYLLENQVLIPPRVTLVGEFNGVNADDYGTVLLCNKSYTVGDSVLNNAQIVVYLNGGINGFTFYYPNQLTSGVIEYGYTIYAYNNDTTTMSNLFFINSFRGIAVNTPTEGMGELVNIENIYGTFLKEGITGYGQSDVGYWNNINISPSYCLNALSQYRYTNSTALIKYCRLNLTALTLGDLDDFSFNKINVENAKVGILFPASCRRELQAFWGLLNDVNLTDCVTGVYAERIFSAGSALFTHSSLGKVINNAYEGCLKLSKCAYIELLGDGETMIEKGSESYEVAPSYDDSFTFNIASKLHYIDDLDDTGVTDVSNELQSQINKCASGGLIVLKNGTYRLDNPITVPANMMLTSFGNSFSRTRNSETNTDLVKFISYSNDACVKLSSGSGIQGIRIYNVYKDPDTAYNTLSNSGSDTFSSVKAIGDNTFAINTEATYTFTGFDFTSSSNHYIKYCYGYAYDSFIKAGSSGKIISIVNNLNFISRTYLYNFAQANQTALEKYANSEGTSSVKTDEWEFILDLTRTYTTLIKLINSNEFMLHCFGYGVKSIINSTNSTILAINTSVDNLKDESYAYVLSGGSAKIVNSFRVFGNSFNLISGSLETYGRYDFTNKREKYYNSATSTDDEPAPFAEGLIEDVLTNCEYSLSGVTGASRNSSIKKQGSYSWRASSTTNPAIAYKFAAKDISTYMRKGYLRFYLYCANVNRKGDYAFVELTSGGTCDVDEITVNITKQIEFTGWNEIVIKLYDMEKGPGSFDSSALNYFRFYAINSSCYYYLDYISFYHPSTQSNQIVINDCDTTTNTAGVSLSDYKVEGKKSWMANDSSNAVFACTLSSTNITSYMSNGYLDFYFYVPHLSMIGDYVFVELTSGGNCDIQEITVNAKPYILDDGWSHVQIPLSVFYKGSDNGTFNPSALNFFRLYTLNSEATTYVDNIRLIK